MYVIGLQEVPVYYFWNNPWIESFDRVFKQIDYTRVKYNRLMGILLLVYVRRNHLPKFRSIEVFLKLLIQLLTHFIRFQTQTTVTGFGGFWGNKGGVSVSLLVDGISICLLNSHMAAHYENLEQRITEYNAVIDGQSFRDRNKPQILSHESVNQSIILCKPYSVPIVMLYGSVTLTSELMT